MMEISMKKCGIYCIRNIINDKRYVGKSKNITVRFRNHRSDLNRNKHHSIHLNRSWFKYGLQNFVFEIIEECEIEKLKEREIFWVKLYKSDNPRYGYNGDKVDEIENEMTHSEEVCQAIRNSKIGELNYISKLTWEKVKEIRERYKEDNISQDQLAKEFEVSRSAILHVLLNNTWVDKDYIPYYRKRGIWSIGKSCSEETKKKIGNANRGKPGLCGEKNPNFGKHLSEEQKEKISKARKGKCLGKDNVNFGKDFSGENNPRYGKHVSKELKELYRQTNAKLSWERVREIRKRYLIGNCSQYDLAKEYGVSRSAIESILHNKSWKEENQN